MDRGKQRLRFEQVVALLRDTVDPELSILTVFDAAVTPNPIHGFLANATYRGAYVFTTNFDSLIERAARDRSIVGRRRRPLTVAFTDEESPGVRGCSFEEWLGKPHTPVLFKLHGTLSVAGPRSHQPSGQVPVRSSIGATLDKIGASTFALRLERHKHRALMRCTRGRTLVVIGYSGLDDFDVVPSLAEALGHVRRLIWVSHSEQGATVRQGNSLTLPPALASAAAKSHISVTILRGRTQQALEKLFGIHLEKNHATPTALSARGMLRLIGPAERLFAVGRLYDVAGRYLDAVRWYRVVQRAYARQNVALSATASRFEASAQLTLGNTKRAARLVDRALTLHTHGGDRGELGADLIIKARVAERLGNREEALQACRSARRLIARQQSPSELIDALLLEAQLNRLLGRLGRAATLTSQAVSLSRKFRHRHHIAQCLMEMSRMHRALGRDRAALRAVHAAQDLYERLGNVSGLAAAYLAEGNIRIYRGQAKRALIAYRRSLAIAKAMNRKRSMAIATANIGVVLRAQGAYRRALHNLVAAHRLNVEVRDSEGVARDSENIALIQLAMQNFEEADKWFENALRIYRRIGHRQGVAMTLSNRSANFRLQGKFYHAKRCARLALAMEKRLRRPMGIASALHNMAAAYHAEGRHRSALMIARTAYDLAVSGMYSEVIADCAELLAELYLNIPGRREASKYLRVATRHARKLGARDRSLRLARLRRRILDTSTESGGRT